MRDIEQTGVLDSADMQILPDTPSRFLRIIQFSAGIVPTILIRTTLSDDDRACTWNP